MRAIAAKQIAVMVGLESLRDATPPGAKVMWIRPEYVAVLGKREGIPWYFGWDRKKLAGEIERSKADYVIWSTLYKSDLSGADGDPLRAMEGIDVYCWPEFTIRNFVTGKPEFILWRVDHALLEAELKAN